MDAVAEAGNTVGIVRGGMGSISEAIAASSSMPTPLSVSRIVERNAPKLAPARHGRGASPGLSLQCCATPVGPTGAEMPQASASRGARRVVLNFAR